MLKATRWFAAYNTQSGWPNVVGASVRTGSIDPAIQNTLPMFERFSHTEPFFATVAEHYLARCERQDKSIFSGETLSPLICRHPGPERPVRWSRAFLLAGLNPWRQNPDPFFNSKSQFLEVVCGSKPTFAMVYRNDHLEIKQIQILKGSGHDIFERLEKIDGMDISPADETKQCPDRMVCAQFFTMSSFPASLG